MDGIMPQFASRSEIWPEVTRNEREDAYTMAGHAVIARLQGLKILQISIDDPDDRTFIDVLEPDLPARGRPLSDSAVRR